MAKMICQVCKAQLPFKLDDGSWFFEKVEFLPELKKRHYQNYLALCPNMQLCSARQQFRGFDAAHVLDLERNELEVFSPSKT